MFRISLWKKNKILRLTETKPKKMVHRWNSKLKTSNPSASKSNEINRTFGAIETILDCYHRKIIRKWETQTLFTYKSQFFIFIHSSRFQMRKIKGRTQKKRWGRGAGRSRTFLFSWNLWSGREKPTRLLPEEKLYESHTRVSDAVRWKAR